MRFGFQLPCPLLFQNFQQMVSSHQPLLIWWSPYRKSSSSDSSSSSSSNPSLASLNEALNEPLCLPRRPPSAQLSHFSLARNPPFLDNLTRSTLPTASLSPPAIVSSDSGSPTSPTFRTRSSAQSNDDLDSPKISLNQSPPSRSSLDSLRNVSQQVRRSHTRSASAALPPSNLESNNFWWWFSGNKENVDTLLSEDDRAATVQEEQANIRKKYFSPRNPVVFCHGLLGFDSVTIGPSIAPMQVMHWRGIKEVLEANGTEVLITRVPATSSPIDRAKVLEEKISEAYPGRSVHLIGHSMGGIDARYLTSRLTDRKFSVLSITTIATPHRGSYFADHFLATLGSERMASFLSLIDLLPNGGGDGKAFESLTIESMRKFNEEVPNMPGVKYFSWGSIYEPGLVDTWRYPHSVVFEKEGPNDGLVSVHSARWASCATNLMGKYLGTLENVNHLDLVGWINPARFKWAEMTGKHINFRPATFYLGIADMLAREVDGVVDDTANGPHNDSRAGEGAIVRSDTPEIGSQRQSSNTARSRDPSSGSSPGPTEMIFAADEGEVIDNVVLRTEIIPSRSHSPLRPTSLPNDVTEDLSQKLTRTKRVSATPLATGPSRTEKKVDGILPNWANIVSDSLSSLASRSSTPSSRSS
ncbi:hypothetical protein GYMLUDRAFT_210269 [Collybiopsis luxurians FD-317 M1]|nr:hypothetical protein GYMLUDRAFT_210269 [Collybiopsis luxurians FD-317 M1]